MSFIHEDFLLNTKTAQRLYRQFAADQPILDYHCHLPPQDVAENRRFKNLFEIWLEGDHYKWRAMRANGVSEKLVTGNASPLEKFKEWARTVPHTLRNPLYHWTHLELKRYFGIDELLNESTAPAIWKRANEQMQSSEFTARGILATFKVRALCTTDDPADELSSHVTLRDAAMSTRVYPTFRPDRVLDVHQPDVFNPWVDRLAKAADVHVARMSDLLDALGRRHQAFHDL